MTYKNGGEKQTRLPRMESTRPTLARVSKNSLLRLKLPMGLTARNRSYAPALTVGRLRPAVVANKPALPRNLA